MGLSNGSKKMTNESRHYIIQALLEDMKDVFTAEELLEGLSFGRNEYEPPLPSYGKPPKPLEDTGWLPNKDLPKCECGAEHDSMGSHSDWCPMYNEVK